MAHRPFEMHGAHLLEYFHTRHKPCPAEARPFVLIAAILASGLAYLDYTVIYITMPALQADFAATIAQTQWVVNAYALFLAALILVGGGLGDRIGRRRIFLFGILIFMLASVACAMAPGIDMLIVARAVQGVGAALLIPQSLAIISANFPKEIRGKAIGTWAAASGITTALGPPIGGFLVDYLSWRAAFWVNIPLALVAIWLTYAYIEESQGDGRDGPIDWLGAAVAALSFGALTYGFTIISDPSAGLGTIAVWIVAGLAGLGAFVAIEARAQNPIMPLDLFGNQVFTGVNLTTFLLYGALAGVMFLVPFDLVARRGFTAAEAGLVMLPLGLLVGLASRYTGDLGDKYGPRPFLVGGPILFSIGCFGFTFTDQNVWVGAVIPFIIVAAGMALVVSPLTTAVMNAAPDDRSGAASGVNNTASRLSPVLAIAIFGGVAGLVFSWAAPDATTFGLIPPEGDPARADIASAFASAYSVSILFVAIWAVAAAAVAYVSLAGTGPTRSAEPAQDEG